MTVTPGNNSSITSHSSLVKKSLVMLKDRAMTSVPENVLDKHLYASIKRSIHGRIKGRRWGAYDSANLVKTYKARGGRYASNNHAAKASTQHRSQTSNLSRWFGEQWIDACMYANTKRIKPCGRADMKKSIAYCRPLHRKSRQTPKTVKEIGTEELKRRCQQKHKGHIVRRSRVARPRLKARTPAARSR